MTEAKVMLQTIEDQEHRLQFSKFSREDVLKLGLLLVERAKKDNLQIMIDISINGFQVFRYVFPGVRILNEIWVKRKINTVQATAHASWHLVYTMADQQRTQESMFLPPTEYAACGGAFPILIKDTGMIGAVCVSGLSQDQDHQVVVDALTQLLEDSQKQ